MRDKAYRPGCPNFTQLKKINTLAIQSISEEIHQIYEEAIMSGLMQKYCRNHGTYRKYIIVNGSLAVKVHTASKV